MAVITPFSALRFNFSKAGAPETICCPPYDVIPDASEWTAKSPHNAILLEGGERLGTSDPYQDAKQTLDEWLRDGTLYFDAAPAFYIYEAAFTAQDGVCRVLRGLTGAMELSHFSEGTVLPHEYTLSKDRADRERLMAQTGCQFSPIYGLFNDPEESVAALLRPFLAQPPELSFTMPDGVTHSLRTVSDTEVCEKLTQLFSDKKIYIADGHHRYETLLHLREEMGTPNHAMIFLTDMNGDGIDIRATHRVLSAMTAYDEVSVLRALEKDFYFSNDGVYCWVTGSGRYRFTPRRPFGESSTVAVLHRDILEPVFGIDAENMAAGETLTYTRSAEEAIALVQTGQAQCAFLLPPPQMSELRQTVLSGEKMPQKSTYFFPKIITGLFMRKFA